MPSTAPTRLPRKLTEKIDGKDVYVVELLNDDLDRVDEISDEYAELERHKTDLDQQVRESDDADERKQLREQARQVSRQQRELDVKMLAVYIEDKDGERFTEEVLAQVPVRVQTALMKQATEKTYGGGEGPTPGTTANG
jgi:predicted transcriptional regulator